MTMDLIHFSSDVLPPNQRLPAFQAGATNYEVQTIGDPADFAVEWTLLQLGEINVIKSQATALRYIRTGAMMQADSADRISVLYLIRGTAHGTYNGKEYSWRAGDAMVWDLVRSFEISGGINQYYIVNIPRFLIDEVLPGVSFAGKVAASTTLTLAFRQVEQLMQTADRLPTAGAAFHARALRDLLMLALIPAHEGNDTTSLPLFQQIVMQIDQNLTEDVGEARLALRCATDAASLRAVTERFGGLDALIERRRLLAAYRRLSESLHGVAVATISAECGFATPTMFSRRFREVFGCSPSQVRLRGNRLPAWAGGYAVPDQYQPLLADASATPD